MRFNLISTFVGFYRDVFLQCKLSLYTFLFRPARIWQLLGILAFILAAIIFRCNDLRGQSTLTDRPSRQSSRVDQFAIRLGLDKPFHRPLGDIAPIVLSAVSGASLAFHETIVHKQSLFQARFPDADPMVFDPSISWRNKYYGGNPAEGRTGVPVQFTDAKHFSMSLSMTSLAGAAFVLPLKGSKKSQPKPLVLVRRAILSYLSFSLANKATRAYFGW